MCPFQFNVVTVFMLFCVFPVSAGEDSLPESLQKMIRKLDDAKTIHVLIRSEVQEMAVWKSKAEMAPGNKLKVSVSVKMADHASPRQISFVSDGVRLITSQGGRQPEVTDAHTQLSNRFQQSLGALRLSVQLPWAAQQERGR